MKPRKTAVIEDIIAMVNERNRTSTCEPAIRDGGNSLLEKILMDNNRYNGFGYLTVDEVPEGHQPGRIRIEGKNTFPDETRRFYFMS